MQASNFGRGIALAAKSDVPTYQAKDYEVPYTDSVATYDENGILTMFIVNKSKEKVDFESTLQNFDVQGLDKATQFCGYDLMKTNEDQSMKLESMNQVTVSDDKVSAELQPLSWNVIRVKVKD